MSKDLKEISERWGVNLIGFENLAIPLKSENYYKGGRNEVNKISKALERKGYRLRGLRYEYSNVVVYAFNDGTYGFGDKIKQDLSGFKYASLEDIQGEQIIDKNIFFGFIYGAAFGFLVAMVLWWLA